MDTNSKLETITDFIRVCMEACDSAAINAFGPGKVRMVIVCELLNKNEKDCQVQALGNTSPRQCIPMLLETLFMLTQRVEGFQEILHDFAKKAEFDLSQQTKNNEN